MNTLKIGDHLTLNIGDFIIISYSNSLDYGWYCGQGRNKTTLQYYAIWSPSNALDNFKEYEQGDKCSWNVKRFEKHGFTSKSFFKSYINSYHKNRILKVTNPDDLFTDPERLKQYNNSKEALLKIKFLNK